jgi:molybdopterin converting factor small subunit
VRVGVRLFARYREAIGRERLEVEVPEGGTVETAWGAVIDRFPALSRYRPFTLFAIGNDYVSPDHMLEPGDEVCLFPPVSGGRHPDPAAIGGNRLRKRLGRTVDPASLLPRRAACRR